MDSSGLKCNNRKKWQVHKHGGKLVRRWRKDHLMIDEKGSELKNNHVSDVAQGEAFIKGLEQKPSAILADGDYNLNRMNEVISDRYPVILQKLSFLYPKMPRNPKAIVIFGIKSLDLLQISADGDGNVILATTTEV